jgi:ribonuclease HI
VSHGRPGRRGGGHGRSRGSGTRELLLTPQQVLERFTGGPQTGIFTDGSCSGNPGPGGWGVVYVIEGRILAERYGSDPRTTNNRMELTALIEALELLGPDEEMDIYSDSELVVKTLNEWAAGWERNGWRRRTGEVKNLDLVQAAYALVKQRPRARIRWIRAHDGSLWNEYADALATTYLRER